jgi:transcription elongation GreA/GreB family factor
MILAHVDLVRNIKNAVAFRMKKKLIQELIDRAKNELIELEKAASANLEFATDQEFKAESKYDTRALEASYLASAEAKRVEELKLEIQILEEVGLESSQKLGEICIGALVELLHQDQKRLYFLIPTAGGSLLKIEDQAVLVVSVFSPIGDALLGLKAGDEFEVETPKQMRSYKVISFQ